MFTDPVVRDTARYYNEIDREEQIEIGLMEETKSLTDDLSVETLSNKDQRERILNWIDAEIAENPDDLSDYVTWMYKNLIIPAIDDDPRIPVSIKECVMKILLEEVK